MDRLDPGCRVPDPAKASSIAGNSADRGLALRTFLALRDDGRPPRRDAILQSHEDELRFHQEALERLRGQYDRLQRWIDTAYEDRLDGRIGPTTYDEKVVSWRADQDQVTQSMQEHERANRSYLDGVVALLELASRAADLFEKQPSYFSRHPGVFCASSRHFAHALAWRRPLGQLHSLVLA